MSSPRVEGKIDDLIDDDPEMADALAAIRAQSGANGGVEWSDVKGDISSGQWGRLIQKGIVVDNDKGQFELADPEAVDAALEDESTEATFASPTTTDDETSADTDDENEGWSTWDKAAGAGVVVIMIGYYYQPVQNVVGGAIDVFLGPIEAALPFYAVIMVLAMLTGLYSSVLRSNLMDSSDMSEYQEKQKELKEREKRAKEEDDQEALEEIREERMEMMTESMGMMTQQIRPMVWIMLLTIPLFLWMWWMINTNQITGTMVMPLLGEVEWSQGVVGPMQAWIVWYFVCSMGFTQLIQKAVDIDMTPTS
jgi:uncharacterized membrane protein (DUF106 family)